MSHQIPTFLLRGINQGEIARQYEMGFFNRAIPDFDKLDLVKTTKKLVATTYGTCQEDPIFTIRGKDNNSIVVATAGIREYEIFTRNGGRLPMGGRCHKCQAEFSHQQKAFAYHHNQEKFLVKVGDDFEYHFRHVFLVDGCFCSRGCTLDYLISNTLLPAHLRYGQHDEYFDLTKRMFYLEDKEQTIVHPTPPAPLLDINGGSLSSEEFHAGNSFYLSRRVVPMLGKTEYIRGK